MLPRSYEVVGRHWEIDEVATLTVRPTEGEMPAFRPGQFAMLYAFGAGEIPISVSGIEDDVLHHTIRRVGGVSRALEQIQRGACIGFRGPFGTPWPLERAEGKDVVVMAGGLGMAPLRPVVRHLCAHRDRFGDVTLLYGTREPSTVLYQREIAQWDCTIDVLITVDSATREWTGSVGLVTALVKRASFDPANTIAMICGPEIMMRFSARELVDRGVDPARVWLSMERNMKCAVGFCGHCQFGPHFICRDGPVLSFDRVDPILGIREL
jgi:NAD(P)H-flavin reductase